MTTIKPATGGITEQLGSTQASDVEHGPATTGTSFRELLQGPEATPPASHAPAAATGLESSAPSALAQAVRSGALTAEQALDKLVERAVTGTGASLSEPQRSELRALLQEALLADPVLRELRDAIGQG
jgi:hypothetical protein